MLQRWEPDAMKDRYAPSAVEILRMVDESLDAYFALPVSQFPDLLQELVNRLDVVLENYANQTIAPCGTCSLNIIFAIVTPYCQVGSYSAISLSLFSSQSQTTYVYYCTHPALLALPSCSDSFENAHQG